MSMPSLSHHVAVAFDDGDHGNSDDPNQEDSMTMPDDDLNTGHAYQAKKSAAKSLLHATKTVAKSWGPAPALTR